MIYYRGAQYRVAVPVQDSDVHAVYYHGTPSKAAADGIRSCGIVPPDVSDRKRRLTCPQQGRVYLTKDLGYAVIYALGANFAGHKLPEYMVKDDPYGYLFVVPGKNLHGDIVLDEDVIGELVYKRALPWLEPLARRVLTPRQYKKVMQGYYAYWAQAGKKLTKVLRPDQMRELLELGSHVGHEGTIQPSECWRIDKRLSVDLKPNGSNFFDLAERC